MVTFWPTIATTLGWYTLSYVTNDNPTLVVVPTETLTLIPQNQMQEHIDFNQIKIPILNSSEAELRNDASTVAITLSDKKAAYFVATMPLFAQELSINPNFTADYRVHICVPNIQKEIGNPCESNQGFIQNLLSVSPKDVSLFSTRSDKIYHSVFVNLKNLYIPADTRAMYQLNSETFTGYMTYSPTASLAFLFDENGDGYELSFLSMSQEEIVEVLQGISLTTN
ncbi:MAG: hypothetical protein ACI9SY_000562 [Candidatus Paceibacteria bacterium]|jgi:hypothetical protein